MPRHTVEYYASRYGVPVSLAKALIGQESGGRNNARSGAGAVGQMQIHLPSHPDVTAAQAMDPDFAWNYGFKLLSSHKKQFGSWRLALAAYNAGPGAVANGDWTSYKETVNYVRNILTKAGVLKPPGAPATSSAPRAGNVTQAPSPLEPSAAGLQHLAAGDYDPTERLEELLQQRLAGQAAGGAPRQSTPRVSGTAQPSEDFKWQDWVRVPKPRGSTSKPAQPEILQFVGQLGHMAGRPLDVWDNTTHSRTTVNGNESAHYTGRAADIPATGKELRRLGYLALRAAGMPEKEARRAQKTGGLFNVGRYQIIFATRIGGNHHNHLHTGLKG